MLLGIWLAQDDKSFIELPRPVTATPRDLPQLPSYQSIPRLWLLEQSDRQIHLDNAQHFWLSLILSLTPKQISLAKRRTKESDIVMEPSEAR